jgi:eukaryotic-like serine/threonine-protein kinase
MSPEQVRGETAHRYSDVFSLGAVLYELFSGRRAFGQCFPKEMRKLILSEEPAPLPKRVPIRIARIIMRCLEKKPTRRYRTAAEVLHELTPLLRG